MIDKSKLNIDRTTTAIGVTVALVAGGALAYGLIAHKDMGAGVQAVMTAAIALLGWLQGAPSAETKKLFKQLGLSEDSANSLLHMDTRPISSRLRIDLGRAAAAAQAAPIGPSQSAQARPSATPEWSRNPQAWEAVAQVRQKVTPKIEGIDLTGAEYAARSMGAGGFPQITQTDADDTIEPATGIL
jgi:hypothetical protein